MKLPISPAELLVAAIVPGGICITGCQFLGVGAAKSSETREQTRIPEFSPAALVGRAVFDANCAKRHGVHGAGTQHGPLLRNDIYNPGRHPDTAFRSAVRCGVPPHHRSFGDMPAQPQVTGERLEQIVRYVRELQLVADAGWADKRGIEPMARLVAYGVGAVEPAMFGLGPAPAVQQPLERAGWKAGEIERIEINEAFAAIVIALIRELGLPEDIVNVEGGVIAQGHSIGAAGVVLTTRLLHSMRRNGLKRGVATLCIGGGQGIALALDALW